MSLPSAANAKSLRPGGHLTICAFLSVEEAEGNCFLLQFGKIDKQELKNNSDTAVL